MKKNQNYKKKISIKFSRNTMTFLRVYSEAVHPKAKAESERGIKIIPVSDRGIYNSLLDSE